MSRVKRIIARAKARRAAILAGASDEEVRAAADAAGEAFDAEQQQTTEAESSSDADPGEDEVEDDPGEPKLAPAVLDPVAIYAKWNSAGSAPPQREAEPDVPAEPAPAVLDPIAIYAKWNDRDRHRKAQAAAR